MSELWNGFQQERFEFEGREAILVFPEHADEGKHWSLKTEYWNAFPETEIALLRKGFHVAYLKNKTRFATKEDCDAKARFAVFLHEKYGLNEKCVPIGMSCGGAHAVSFAGTHPDKVACMFIDAPVLNFCDYPGRLGNEECERTWGREFVEAYPGITRAQLLKFPYHPMNYIPVLKENKIPIIMLYGTEDATVLYQQNGKLMEMEYEGTENLLKVVPRIAQGHHPHGIPWNCSVIVEFILEHC